MGYAKVYTESGVDLGIRFSSNRDESASLFDDQYFQPVTEGTWLARNPPPMPYLRLLGRWLERAGLVSVEARRVVIEVIELPSPPHLVACDTRGLRGSSNRIRYKRNHRIATEASVGPPRPQGPGILSFPSSESVTSVSGCTSASRPYGHSVGTTTFPHR